MIPGLELARRVLYELRLRRRFPRSVIHRGAMADKGSTLGEFSVLFSDAKLENSWLGAYSYVQSGSVIYSAEVGAFCSIASNVVIGLAAHPTSRVSTSPVFYDNAQPLPKFFVRDRQFTHNLPKTFIGADVWIGQGVMIKAGVRIGVGAVIGAGAIVTKDIPRTLLPRVTRAGRSAYDLQRVFHGNYLIHSGGISKRRTSNDLFHCLLIPSHFLLHWNLSSEPMDCSFIR